MKAEETSCQVARTLDVIGEKWSLLIVRNAFRGQTKFSEFKLSLGAPTDILSDRLAKLVEGGVLRKQPYRDPGDRERFSYHLTARGEALRLVVAAMIQWGDEFNPAPQGPGMVLADAAGSRRVRLAYLDDDDNEVPPADVSIQPGEGALTGW